MGTSRPMPALRTGGHQPAGAGLGRIPCVKSPTPPSRPPQSRASLMASLPFFSTLEPADREKLATFARLERYRKGSVLFRKGDAPQSLLAVIEGVVKVSAPSADGR